MLRNVTRKINSFTQVAWIRMSTNVNQKDGGVKVPYKQSDSFSDATITEVGNLSPTVKKLVLEVEAPSVMFKAGQWVDFYIAELDTVAGFSMCTSPRELKVSRRLGLAVKVTSFPPTQWAHQQARVGDRVKVRVSGDFHYDPEPGRPAPDLLLVGGGVGINPLHSIMSHVADLNRGPAGERTSPGRVQLLYSAQTQDELLFRESLEKLCEDNDNLRCRLFVTREKGESNDRISYGRISQKALTSALLSYADESQVHCYLCGPSGMVTELRTWLAQSKVPLENMFYEAWW